MKRILRYIILGCTGCLGAFVASCQYEEEWDASVNSPNAYVTLNLPVEGQASTRVTASKEDAIATADIFIFGDLNTNRNIHHDRITVNQEKVAKVTLSLRQNDVKESSVYDIYVIANYSGADLSTIASLEELRQVVMSTDFQFKESEKPEAPFLMDGKMTGIAGSSLADKNTPLTIELQRAVAKIMVTVEYGTSADGRTYKPGGVIQKRMFNYATKVPVLTEETEFSLLNNGEKRGLTSMTDFISEQSNQALCYSYPNTWKFNSESAEVDLKNESYLILNIPVRIYDKDVNPNAPDAPFQERLDNYYYVPIRGSKANETSDDYVLNRNNFYNITVTVMANGSGDYTKPIELTGKITVQPWQNKDITVGDDNANYLEISQEFLVMNNQAQNNSIEFYSSSDVTVEIVTGSVKYIDKFGVEKDIPASQGYPNNTYVPSVKTENGKIVIDSKELMNVMKTFQIRVTNTDNSPAKTITVEQYPLEYVTSTLGWYSCREDFKSTYEQHANEGTDEMENKFFNSRVVTYYDVQKGSSTIKEYEWKQDNWWGYYLYTFKGNSGSLKNAHMYYIHITSTPKDENHVDYRLGYPKMTNGITDSGEDNKKLVSPAFMIASQLGAVNSSAFKYLSDAAEHCKQYVEVTGATWKNGELNTENVVRYDDWRLPTEAELNIIKKYQDEENSAIDKVLGGNYYWSASGEVNISGGSSGTFLRCVRDVK